MSAHTPGPWVIEHTSAHGADGASIDVRASEGPYRGAVCCLFSAEHIEGITIGEAEANARLIAAAPDLLAAAELMIALRDGTDITHEDAYDSMFKSGGRDNWNALEAAISKALGA